MKQEVLYGIIGLLLGVGITIFVASSSVNNNNMSMMQMMGMSMDEMMTGLEEKTGDDFDKAFISEMIDHHQGAINMAKEAQKNAKHEEIKNLSNDIITAQTNEIKQMKQWQKDWVIHSNLFGRSVLFCISSKKITHIYIT